MNAGLPGAGIGGVFYLVSALLMPLRYAWASWTGRKHEAMGGWRVAWAQAGQAVAIIAAMWGTGWLLARVRWHARLAAEHALGVPLNPHANVIGGVAIGVSVGSLIMVLAAVQLARLVVRREPPPVPLDDGERGGAGMRTAAAVVLLPLAFGLADATPLRAQEMADRAALRSDTATPERAARDTSIVETARALAASGRTDAAMSAYEAWLLRHPDDATAWRELGRARQRAGRPRAAAQAYQRALQLHPDPGTERRLRTVRIAALPVFQPLVGGSTDSDGNRRLTAGASLDAGSFGRVRLGVQASRTRVTPALDTASVGGSHGNGPGAAARVTSNVASSNLFAVTLQFRPRADLSVDGFAGEALMQPVGEPAWFRPAARVRLRARPSPGMPGLELRASSLPVDASSALIAAGAWRDEVGALLDLPVGPFRLRGLGRLGDVRVTADRNPRYTYGGVLALPVSPAIELSAQFQQLSYGHAAPGGYFAPRLAQTIDAGTYIETDLGDHFSVAADLGGGLSRLARFGQVVPDRWGPALRLWSMLTWRVAPRCAFDLEAEAYDTRASQSVATVPAASWRYGSLNLSTRISM